MKTEDILNEREKTHGDFKDVAYIHDGMSFFIRKILENKGCNNQPSSAQILAINNICIKIARIVCGDPDHADHWDDISGYAMLGKGKQEKHHFFSCRNGLAPCDCEEKNKFAKGSTIKITPGEIGNCSKCGIVIYETDIRGAGELFTCLGCYLQDKESTSSKMEHMLEEKNHDSLRRENEELRKKVDKQEYYDYINNIHREATTATLNELKEAISKMERAEEEWHDAEKCLPLIGREIIANIRSNDGAFDLNQTATLRAYEGGVNIALIRCLLPIRDIGPYKVIKWKYAEEQTGDKTFWCTGCEKEIKGEGKDIGITSDGMTMFNCEDCHEKLIKHFKKHVEAEVYRCDSCNYELGAFAKHYSDDFGKNYCGYCWQHKK